MVNIQDFIGNSFLAKKLKAGDLLFAEFKCPLDEKKSNLWWHNNFFAHVLSGETLLKTPRQEYILKAGSSAFAKKGSVLTHNHVNEDFCELLVFVPDDFIKTVVKRYQVPSATNSPNDPGDTVILLNPDDVLIAYFQSLLIYFHQSVPPVETLLKLKFEELLLYILSNNNHLPLKYYFTEICKSAKPSVKEIMEANFFSNLSLEEFARLCARSLTAFKKEFSDIFNNSPGKWLLEKRLEYGRYLLEITDFSIDEICLESGFEDASHFIRVFKSKYGLPPHKFQKLKKLM